MKTISITYLALLCLLMSCSNGERNKYSVQRDETANEVESPATLNVADSIEITANNTSPQSPEQAISSSAAVENIKDTIHKFIRTADVKFKVKDVIKTTYQIEDITQQMGGFVEQTRLTSRTDNTNIVKLSEDSSLEMTYYTVLNNMTLRVPNIKLDATLKAIAPLIDHMDYRTIKAEDVALKLMANKFAQKRAERHKQRLTKAVDEKGKKVAEITDAEESVSNKQEQADNAALSSLELQDKIAYSTITLDIYQRQAVKKEVVANDKNIDAYKPNLFKRLWQSLGNGWEIIADFLVAIAQLWGFILFGVIIFLVARYAIRRNGTKHRI